MTVSGPNQVGFLSTLSPRYPPDTHPLVPWGPRTVSSVPFAAVQHAVVTDHGHKRCPS